jgi:hypothetical protein
MFKYKLGDSLQENIMMYQKSQIINLGKIKRDLKGQKHGKYRTYRMAKGNHHENSVLIIR